MGELTLFSKFLFYSLYYPSSKYNVRIIKDETLNYIFVNKTINHNCLLNFLSLYIKGQKTIQLLIIYQIKYSI